MKSPALSLTERHLAVLQAVHAWGWCTIAQIQRRFRFSSPSAAYDCAARLVQAEYLSSTRLPSFSGRGSGKTILSIGPKAKPLLAELLGFSSLTDMGTWRRPVAAFYWPHFLAGLDFRISLELATQGSPFFDLSEWTEEREVKRSPIRVKDPKTNQDLVLVPDGGFTLEATGVSQQFWVEIDMGTIGAKRMRPRLRGYLSWPGTRSAPVLFVVPNKARQDALTLWAKEEAQAIHGDPTIFWMATMDAINEATVLQAPIWSIVGGPTLALADLAVSTARTQPQPLVGSIAFAGGFRS